MKKALVLSVALALVAGAAYANFCARDVVPSATLLAPYVVVGLDASNKPDPNGQTTIMGITNVSRNAVIIHVTVWDALSVPQVDFDEILSGYDVLQINWRDFLNGRFDYFDTSKTAFTASSPYTFDPFEWGPDGRGEPAAVATTLEAPQNRNVITTAQCANVPPYGNRSDLSATIISKLRGAIDAPYSNFDCDPTDQYALRSKDQWAETLTGNPLFFYVTVDTVSTCSLEFPDSDAYWAGIATSNNVLLGDIIWLNSGANYSEANAAVHIEAGTFGPVFNFYEDYGVASNREPLATAFAFRYADDNDANIHSALTLWKNYEEIEAGEVSSCGAYLYYAWDNDERSLSTSVDPISGIGAEGRDPNQFPLETQQVPLTSAYFDLPAAYGWMLLALPPAYASNPGYIDVTPEVGGGYTYLPYMGWAGLQFTYGTYSAGMETAIMANTHCFANEYIPVFNTNTDAPYVPMPPVTQ